MVKLIQCLVSDFSLQVRKLACRLALTTSILVAVSACQSLGVEPWQRDILAQPDMQFGTANLTSTLGQHFYFSKEASSGGKGFAGGGCGCN